MVRGTQTPARIHADGRLCRRRAITDHLPTAARPTAEVAGDAGRTKPEARSPKRPGFRQRPSTTGSLGRR